MSLVWLIRTGAQDERAHHYLYLFKLLNYFCICTQNGFKQEAVNLSLKLIRVDRKFLYLLFIR